MYLRFAFIMFSWGTYASTIIIENLLCKTASHQKLPSEKTRRLSQPDHLLRPLRQHPPTERGQGKTQATRCFSEKGLGMPRWKPILRMKLSLMEIHPVDEAAPVETHPVDEVGPDGNPSHVWSVRQPRAVTLTCSREMGVQPPSPQQGILRKKPGCN